MISFKYIPTVGLGVVLIFKISGRGIMDPDAPSPLETLTFVPSSKYLIPILTGFLHKKISISTLFEKKKRIMGRQKILKYDITVWQGQELEHLRHVVGLQRKKSHLHDLGLA